MKKCNYCGNSNDDSVQFCAGCGTALDTPKEARNLSASAQKRLPRTLDAKTATIILFAYFAVQLFCGYLMEVVGGWIAAAQGIHDLQQVYLISDALAPMMIVLSFLLGGIVIIMMSFKLIPERVKDVSPTGAAWISGRLEIVAKGLAIGLVIGVCDQIFIVIAKHHVAYRNLDPLHRMAFTPGLAQIAWVVVAVLLAPTVEEMIFRGILYGGYRKSFGPVWAAVSTTVIFVALHYPYYIHFPSNIIGIIVAALATLWCRLHWNAIGPAIAAHVGYNAMAALLMIYWTWH